MDSAELLQIGKKQNNVFMQSHILLFAGYPLQFLFFGAILLRKGTFDISRLLQRFSIYLHFHKFL